MGVIPTSLPSQTDGTSDVAADKKSVTVNLLIGPDSIELSAANTALNESTLAALAMSFKKKADGFDLELMSKALFEIKRRYPNSDTVIVLPTDRVEYQNVVRVLDAARELKPPKDSIEKPKPLFPVVVLSRKI